MKTKKTEKELWISALRSGNYKQGPFNLYNPDDNSYCCIGVLGCIKGIPLAEMENKGDWGDPIYKQIIPSFLDEIQVINLINMNDELKKDFEKIADWIQENIKE